MITTVSSLMIITVSFLRDWVYICCIFNILSYMENKLNVTRWVNGVGKKHLSLCNLFYSVVVSILIWKLGCSMLTCLLGFHVFVNAHTKPMIQWEGISFIKAEARLEYAAVPFFPEWTETLGLSRREAGLNLCPSAAVQMSSVPVSPHSDTDGMSLVQQQEAGYGGALGSFC